MSTIFRSLKEYSNNHLNEAFDNVFKEQDKLKYVDKVWDMLQDAYASQGGLHGSGFKNKEDMIANIAFWKIGKTGGKVNSVVMYKDKDGRKRIAVATDGTEEGKMRLLEIMKTDIVTGRAYVEISGRSLSTMKKLVDIKKYAVSVKDVIKKLHKDEILTDIDEDDPELVRHPEFKDFFYRRDIGGALHTKMMLGNINADPIGEH